MLSPHAQKNTQESLVVINTKERNTRKFSNFFSPENIETVTGGVIWLMYKKKSGSWGDRIVVRGINET